MSTEQSSPKIPQDERPIESEKAKEPETMPPPSQNNEKAATTIDKPATTDVDNHTTTSVNNKDAESLHEPSNQLIASTSAMPAPESSALETTDDNRTEGDKLDEENTEVEMELAPLPTEFDPDAPLPEPKPISAEDQITSNPFGVIEHEDQDDLNSISDHNENNVEQLQDQEQEQGEGGEEEDEQINLMEYITSLQQSGATFGEEEEVREGEQDQEQETETEEGENPLQSQELVEQSEHVEASIDNNNAENTTRDAQQLVSTPGKEQAQAQTEQEGQGDQSHDRDQAQEEGEEQSKDKEGTNDVEMAATRASSPLTPASDIPELPDTLSFSPKNTTDPLPPIRKNRTSTQTKKSSADISEIQPSVPHAESSSAARRRSSTPEAEPVPEPEPENTDTTTTLSRISAPKVALKLGTKRSSIDNVQDSKEKAKLKGKPRGRGPKGKEKEIVIDYDDLNSLSDPEELRELDDQGYVPRGGKHMNEESSNIEEEVVYNGDGKRPYKKQKVGNGKAKAKKGPGTKKRLDATSGIKVSDKPPEKITPRGKGMSDAVIKQQALGKTKEVQVSTCQRPRYGVWGKCTQCIAKVGGDSCRFRDLRSFPVDPESGDITGPGFFETTEWKDEITPLPTEFNRDFEEEDIIRTEKTVAPMLLPLITSEARHVFGKKAIKRGMDAAKHRSVCDFCSSTIFGGWFFCKTCGRDFCLSCERYFPDSLETIMESPWPMPDAARPRLLKCQHEIVLPTISKGKEGNDGEKTQRQPPRPKGPAMHSRLKLQAISRFDENELKDHWLRLFEFVLDDININNIDDIAKDSNKNITDDKHRGHSDESMTKTKDFTNLDLESKLNLMGLSSLNDDQVKNLLKNHKLLPLPQKSNSNEDDVDVEPIIPLPKDDIVIDSSLIEEGEKNQEENHGNDSRSIDKIEKQKWRYTKITNPHVEPIPDPAELSEHSREFMLIDDKDLTNAVFDKMWSQGEPIVVDNVDKKLHLGWGPDDFIERFGQEECYVVNCQTNVPQPTTVGKFFEKFKDVEGRNQDILKLKDWPATDDFKNTHPELYNDFCDALPVPDYTRREGVLNLYSHFPPGPTRPDIGPKMYNAFKANELKGGFGSTRLHMDVADAVNLLLYSSSKNLDGNGNGDIGCAVWDLFRSEDSDLIRQFLIEKFGSTYIFTDPIHSQLFYLDSNLRKELFETKNVKSWRIYQYPGQAVFIPAGCAHQVCNLSDCIKIALDFVSPHNVRRCQQLTADFRKENFAKAWKEDVLQLYNVLWYSWLSCIETRKRRIKKSEQDAITQKAREDHLASLRKGQHESSLLQHHHHQNHQHHSNTFRQSHIRLGSPLSSAPNQAWGGGNWNNVSSVRDEPHFNIDSTSSSISRGGSPTLARIMNEDEEEYLNGDNNNETVNKRNSNGDEPNKNDDNEDDNDKDKDEIEEKEEEEKKEKAKNQEEKRKARRNLAEGLLSITLKKEPPSSSEIFLGSKSLYSTGKKNMILLKSKSSSSSSANPISINGSTNNNNNNNNNNKDEFTESKPTLSARQLSLIAKQKELEKREKERQERRLKNPPRELRTSTLIKLGAKKIEDVLELAKNDMFTPPPESNEVVGLGQLGQEEIWPNPNPNPHPNPLSTSLPLPEPLPEPTSNIINTLHQQQSEQGNYGDMDTDIDIDINSPMTVDLHLDPDIEIGIDTEMRDHLRSLQSGLDLDQDDINTLENNENYEDYIDHDNNSHHETLNDFENHITQQSQDDLNQNQIAQNINTEEFGSNLNMDMDIDESEELAAHLRLVGEMDMDDDVEADENVQQEENQGLFGI
ncbi:uncharacterized protein L201_000065 [Kwoniella dendrophila CBS 6074]|uniref:JmjC domain-containing protein n=1 Tax=Kwoniella dendrophila CBS 6074 TaxID=1295534 RepID=A0AAX4JJN7_9TREE